MVDGHEATHSVSSSRRWIFIASNLASAAAILVSRLVDPDLRTEVESLLRSDRHAGDFLSSEKLRGHIARLGSKAGVPEVCSEVGPYRILSEIGAGAMGEVFLAHDRRLDRRVALKVLPHRFTGDSGRVSRFVREAKAASALNHPNIITIYEIGEYDATGTCFEAYGTYEDELVTVSGEWRFKSRRFVRLMRKESPIYG